MPELPEVETIKLALEKKIAGFKIQKIQVLSAKSFLGNPNEVEGQKVLKVWRRAKILGIDLSGDKTLLFHLKMSGQIIWEGNRLQATGHSKFVGGHPTQDMLGQMPNAHTRVIFSFSDGSHLYFNDQRKFGWVRVVDRQQAFGSEAQARRGTGDSSLKNLGPEPLEKEFTWEILKENLLKHKSQPVKVAIMDQSVVAGVGNIYSNEACFDAKLDPRIKVGDMDDKNFQALYKGIITALKEGIKHKGSTMAHFVDPEGHKGYFLDYAFVYGRDGLPCKVCRTKIKKITLGGRGTYFCPKDQK